MMVAATEQEIIDSVQEIEKTSYVTVTMYQAEDSDLRKYPMTRQPEQVWIIVARAKPSHGGECKCPSSTGMKNPIIESSMPSNQRRVLAQRRPLQKTASSVPSN